MADEKNEQQGRNPTAKQVADVGVPNPEPIRQLAEDLPEGDEVKKAYKAGMLASSAQHEAQAKVRAVKASPNAEETPSGHALKEAAGVSNDSERGEEYLRAKTARRWGYAHVE